MGGGEGEDETSLMRGLLLLPFLLQDSSQTLGKLFPG